jgi:uncharacterized membrane protein
VHYLILLTIILVGTGLRFGNLTAKPIWVDEVFTALFSLGQSFERLPLGEVIPLTQVGDLFTLQPNVGCAAIAQHLTAQSTHPPLFFCLMHEWLLALQPSNLPLLWQLRALPALFGIAAIAAVYGLARLAFNRKAGLAAAALIAVSPFGVYQSQEARHYTLPILLITLGLIGLVQIDRDLRRQRLCWQPWLLLVLTNSIGLYVHYFHVIAVFGQLLSLFIIFWRSRTVSLKIWAIAFSAFLIPLLLYLPWLPTLIHHFDNPKANWLPEPSHIAPIAQIAVSIVLMAIAPPVERQPLGVIILAIIATLLLMIGLAKPVWQGSQQLRSRYPNGTVILSSFVIGVLAQFFVIIYILGKDISIAPRYNFVYYSAFCALLAASLSQLAQNRSLSILLSVSLVSSLCVIFNLSFLKPYHPLPVAAQLNEVTDPLLVVVGYRDPLEIALGLSYALSLESLSRPNSRRYLAFLNNEDGYNLVWNALAELEIVPQNLWVFAPGLVESDYPAQLTLTKATETCDRDPQEYHRQGIPYQLYRCAPFSR